MARIRTVKPDFWGSAKTAKVSRDARLLFLGLLNQADDEGRLLASSKTISGNVFPNDHAVTADDVAEWMTELEAASFIDTYHVDGVLYCQVVGFTEHQRVSNPTPSRLPPKPSGAATELLTSDSGEPTGSSPLEVEREVEREVEVTPSLVAVPAPLPDVKIVFDAWIASTGRTGQTQLDKKRRRLIGEALKAYPLDDVVDAVRGWRNSPFHCGQNDRGRAYNDLGLLLRDADHIEAFRDLERQPPGAPVPKRYQALLAWADQKETA